VTMPSPDKSIYPEGKDCSKCVHCKNIILGKCKCDVKGDIEPDVPITFPFTWGDDAKSCAKYRARPEFKEAERMVDIYLVLVQDEKGIDRIVGARMDAMAAGEMLTKSSTDENGKRIAEGHIEVWDAGAFTTDILVVLGAKGGADMDVLGVYGTRQGADRMAQRGMNDGLRIKVEEWGVLE